MSHRILLIDDEDDILEFIRYNLTISGRIRLAHHRPLCRAYSISCQTYPILYDESPLSPISYAGTCCRAGGVARIEGRSNTAQAPGQEHIRQGRTFS